ncbi:hepatitis A virus cellular receptor 1 homolog [Nelusetta ayraudi]|uniref:hepatitis A virus cellular receptor 1 homolog n=1 Tax=Nelusetta ayraudi TaxID=303726 RepID=UPI003F6F9F7D
MLLPLVLRTFSSVCLLTACVSAGTTDTVVGVAGTLVVLPCRVEAELQSGDEVCWGRGKPSLLSCHNSVIHQAAGEVTYRKSDRFSLLSSFSLSISNPRPSDSGFFHCRVLLPGLFNDQTVTLHLIILRPHIHPTQPSHHVDSRENLNRSDVTAHSSTGAAVAQVQGLVQQQIDGLQIFIGNTVRASFIIFIPALLLTAAYRVWKLSQTEVIDRRSANQGERTEEESSV